jgi:predicted transcriptional regulator of viral defense system
MLRPVPADPADLRRAVNSIALRQAGYFTASQARAAGYSYQAQKYHVGHGNWTRVDRGLFRLPDWPAGEDDAYVLWRLWSREQGVVSHQSALAIHGLDDMNPAPVHLTVPPGFRAADPCVVLHKGSVPPADVQRRAGYQVTTAERTLLDVAAAGISQEQFNATISEALERRLISPHQLRARSDDFGDRAALRVERALGTVAWQDPRN